MLKDLQAITSKVYQGLRASKQEQHKYRRHAYLLYKRASTVVIIILLCAVAELSILLLSR